MGKARNVGALTDLADDVAISLLGQLKRGEIKKVSLETLEAALRRHSKYPPDAASRRELTIIATKRLVEWAARDKKK